MQQLQEPVPADLNVSEGTVLLLVMRTNMLLIVDGSSSVYRESSDAKCSVDEFLLPLVASRYHQQPS